MGLTKRDEFILKVRLAVAAEEAFERKEDLLELRYKMSRGKNRDWRKRELEKHQKSRIDFWKDVPRRPQRLGMCIELVQWRKHLGEKSMAEKLEEQFWCKPTRTDQAFGIHDWIVKAGRKR